MITAFYGCFAYAQAETLTNIASLDEIIIPSPAESMELIPVEISQETIFENQRSFAIIGQPKYSNDFLHFGYVNPDAPKGGMMRFSAIGTYDNFNRYSSRGSPERRSGELYETLFTQSEDETGSYYPLLAESARYSDAYRWIEVNINPDARFHDGQPVTADDVVFSFNKFMTEGVPQYRTYNQGITVTKIAPLTVRVELPEANREHLIGFVGSLKILPKHFWQNHRLDEPLSTPPLGGGAYYIKDYKLGQYSLYQRDPNYWGSNLPVNKGRHNFDQLRYDYYLDDSVALEAFKAGAYDVRSEGQPKNWYTQYSGPAFDKNDIIKKEKPALTAPDARWLAFNVSRPIFKNREVRQAISMAFDFKWLNKAFYYNSYKQPRSYFENTPYAATEPATPEELTWLDPFAHIVPLDAFLTDYQPTEGSDNGFNRDNLLKADALLTEAGWIIENQKRVHQTTKQPFEFELLVYMGSNLQYILPFQKNLERLGITMKISMVDYTQINNRLRERDYDMMPTIYYGYSYPSSSLKVVWGSEYLNSSWNSSGLHNEAIDYLLAQIVNNQDNEENLLTLGRALDRVLTHEYAMIPMWYPNATYYAYWDKFLMPEIMPKYTIGIDTWWFDDSKFNDNQTTQQPNEHD